MNQSLRLLLGMVSILLATATPVLGGDFAPILATAQGEHVWVVIPKVPSATDSEDSTTVCHVVHYSVQDGPSTARAVVRLPRWPERITSFGAQLWIVFAPKDAEVHSRDVVSLQVLRDPATDLFYAIPRNHLEVLPSLPMDAQIAGFLSCQGQLVSLAFPPQRALRGISRTTPVSVKAEQEDDASKDDSPGAVAKPSLLRLEGLNWETIPSPDGFSEASKALLGRVSVEQQQVLAVLWPSQDGEGCTIATGSPTEVPEEKSRWHLEQLQVPFSQVRSLLAVEGGMLLVHGKKTIDFSYVRAEGRLAKLASIQPGGAPWDVAALADGIRIFERQADRFTVQRVGLIDGVLGEPVEISEKSDGFDWLQAPLAGIIILSVLVLVLVLRPLIGSASSDPSPDLRPLPLGRRMAALLIDVVPGAIIVMAVFDLSAREFAESFVSIRVETSFPALLVVLITGVHSGISECIWGASMGKFVLGAGVSALDGNSATRLQRTLRAACKMAVLLLPLLALLVMLDPLSRGLPELISRTVVVNRKKRRGMPSKPVLIDEDELLDPEENA